MDCVCFGLNNSKMSLNTLLNKQRGVRIRTPLCLLAKLNLFCDPEAMHSVAIFILDLQTGLLADRVDYCKSQAC